MADALMGDRASTLRAGQRLRVTAMDSGTWPMDGGGVAACRQTVLEGLPDLAWTVQAETSNDLKTVQLRSAPACTN